MLHPSVIGSDGPTFPYVTTVLEGAEITYFPPVRWALSGGRFIPPGKTEADAYVEAVPIQGPAPWTPERAKAAHEAVLARIVPKGATNAAVVSEGATSFRIAGQCGYEICFSYAYYGQEYGGSVIFVEHGKTQLQFHLGCLKRDFDTLRGALNGSLFTLRGL